MLDVVVRSATDKESTEPCRSKDHPIKPGEPIVVCQRCLVVSHVTCWNELGRCAEQGCTNVGFVQTRQVAADGCPYCAETLPSPRPSKCPHCGEYLNPVMLRQALETERYNRCPGGIKGVAVWFKFQGGLTTLGALIAMFGTAATGEPGIALLALFLAGVGVGYWKVGDGVRHGKRWARSWALGLSCLQLFGRGMLFGIACLLALNSEPARAYFADRE